MTHREARELKAKIRRGDPSVWIDIVYNVGDGYHLVANDVPGGYPGRVACEADWEKYLEDRRAHALAEGIARAARIREEHISAYNDAVRAYQKAKAAAGELRSVRTMAQSAGKARDAAKALALDEDLSEARVWQEKAEHWDRLAVPITMPSGPMEVHYTVDESGMIGRVVVRRSRCHTPISAMPSPPIALKRCPHCGRPIPETSFKQHIEADCPTGKPLLFDCPMSRCQARLLLQDMIEHMSRVHQAKGWQPASTASPPATLPSTSGTANPPSPNVNVPRTPPTLPTRNAVNTPTTHATRTEPPSATNPKNPHLPLAGEPTVPDTGTKKCPICGRLILAAMLSRHLRDIHQIGEAAARAPGTPSAKASKRELPPVAAPPVPLQQVARCSQCGSPVRSDRLGRHQRETCPQRAAASPAAKASPAKFAAVSTQPKNTAGPSAAASNVPLTLQMRCPACDRTMLAHTLRSHMKKAHPGQEVDETMLFGAWDMQYRLWHDSQALRKATRGTKHKAQPPAPKSQPATRDRKASKSVSIVPGWKAAGMQPEVAAHLGGADLHDASRGLGHFARERGRFGSHPVHDDYGDGSDS